MGNSQKNKMAHLLRAFLSFGLIAFILWKVNWPDFINVLVNINLWYIPPFFLLSFVMIWISCLKWQLLLEERNIGVGMGKLFSLYLIGYFFNYFMPGRYGGDLARSYILGREIKTIPESVSSVFLERFTGLTALVVFTFFASLINRGLLKESSVLIPVIVIETGYLIMIFLLFSETVRKISERIRNRFSSIKLIDKLIECHHIILTFKKKKGLIMHTMLLSFLFHVMAIFNVILACLCLDIHVNFMYLALFVPIVQLACMVPVSINGFGIQEGVYIYLFSLVGIPLYEALSVSLLLRMKNILLSLVGGVLFSTAKKKLPESISG